MSSGLLAQRKMKPVFEGPGGWVHSIANPIRMIAVHKSTGESKRDNLATELSTASGWEARKYILLSIWTF